MSCTKCVLIMHIIPSIYVKIFSFGSSMNTNIFFIYLSVVQTKRLDTTGPRLTNGWPIRLAFSF